MSRTCSFTLAVLLAPAAYAGPTRVCNNQPYNVDQRDPVVDVNLYSECWHTFWGVEVKHRVKNLTADETYDVDYKSAKFYVPNLPPGKTKEKVETGFPSCVEVNRGMTGTRTLPAPADAAVTIDTAPACDDGWRTIELFGDIIGVFAMTDPDPPGTLAMALEVRGGSERALATELRVDHAFGFVDGSSGYAITSTLTNPTASTLTVTVDYGGTPVIAVLPPGEEVTWASSGSGPEAEPAVVRSTVLVESDDGDVYEMEARWVVPAGDVEPSSTADEASE